MHPHLFLAITSYLFQLLLYYILWTLRYLKNSQVQFTILAAASENYNTFWD